MAELTKQELIELDSRIDSAILSQGLFDFNQDVAAIHLLRFFEDYARLHALTRPASIKVEAYTSMLKAGQDGMHFAINWVYQHCPSPIRRMQLDLQVSAYVQSGLLHEAAMRYSGVWDLMAMLQRGRAVAESDRDGVVRVRFTNPEAEDVEVASQFVAHSDNPDSQEELDELASEMHPERFLGEVPIRSDRQGGIKYFIPDEVFEHVAECQRQILSSKWELDGTWDVGGYTLAQFRDFWTALLTFCWIHQWACMRSGVKGGALNSVVKMRHRDGWVEDLARRCALDASIIRLIIDDLTYEPALYSPGRKQPDVVTQPFFPLRHQLLALSNQLALLSNAERNLWDLVSIKRPEIHSVLRNMKEELWLRQLTPRLEEYGLRVFGPIKFSHAGRRSDLDLLILDRESRFGLGCQLKWLTSPDRIRDVSYADNELLKGIAQAALSLEWLNSRPGKLEELTRLTAEELADVEFRAAVLSKNTIGSAWTYRPGIPIISERLTDWIVGRPHQRSLRTLWQVGDERRYMPQRGKHFVDEDAVVEFGGVRFVGERMSMRVITAWDPVEDINFSGL